MKILLSSHRFYPDIGGIEAISAMLAEEFWESGHEVRVVTQTPTSAPDRFAYPVLRRPGWSELLAQVRWCDVFLHNNISLRTAAVLPLVRRPWAIAHQTWLTGKLKHGVTRFATNIAISQAIAAHLSQPSVIIGNPYCDRVFREMPNVPRRDDLIFVGRLVSDKGCDVLLRALSHLRQWELVPNLTVVGDGPELDNLQRLAAALQVAAQVQFVGSKTGTELAQILNAHHIAVVPSRWREPFGIVALEAIACGCVVVGSAGGGLPDAIGPCGLTFPNGDVAALAAVLREFLEHPEVWQRLRQDAATHLSRHRAAVVARAYLDVLESIAEGT